MEESRLRRRSPRWDRDGEKERERKRQRDDVPSESYKGEGRDENPHRPPASSAPSLISWFLGTLPTAQSFDGMLFELLVVWHRKYIYD
jgi:hypothetical protein